MKLAWPLICANLISPHSQKKIPIFLIYIFIHSHFPENILRLSASDVSHNGYRSRAIF